jgi:tetratricopeptide (TPR) repeat protein
MAAKSNDDAKPLTGQILYLFGRFHGLTRRRLDQLIRTRGGRLALKPGPRVTGIAFGHSSVANVLPDGQIRMPAGLPSDAELLSEQELRRRLGLLRPPEAMERNLGVAELERLAGLTPRLVSCLALFDVLQPVDGRYGYRDLVAAREVGRLIGRGIELRRVLEAAVALRGRGGDLSQARLAEGPAGTLLHDCAGQLAEFDGQLTIGLGPDPRTVDELVAEAETAAEENDLAAAENLYATALRADTTDPVLPFNLGNVFAAQGRAAEAKIAWQIAVARDPAFADAWYNLAMAAEDESHMDLAIAEYRRAVQASPDYADAHFNLALLLTKLNRYDEALAVWEAVLGLETNSKQAAIARRAAALCRMELQRSSPKAG